MARRVFFSFHYKPDSFRVSKVKQMGVVEGQPVLSSNKWEEVKKGGDPAIKQWIDKQMKGKSCSVVLVGTNTAGRKWVNYEFEKAWSEGKGVVGIYIHNLLDHNQKQSSKGKNPFASHTLKVDGVKKSFSSIVKCYDPPYSSSSNVYKHIKENIEAWIEEAIKIRNKY